MSELIKAMAEVNDLNRSHGVVQRGGKKYTEVFVRVEAFRKAFGTDHGINTDVVADDGKPEEIRGQGNVNKTSALENAETSAIGRALASLGLHGGTYASLNEIDAVPRKAAAQQQARSTQPAPTPPPAPAADLVPLKTHLGKELRKTEHQDFAVSLIKMFQVYANTTQDKDGNEVEPRKRMTLMRELKEHNADAIAAISEGLQDQVEKAYLKNIKSLGAQLKND